MPADKEMWGGEERRGIPIHILTYIDEKLEVHSQQMVDEIESVRGDIRALTASVTSWMEKQPTSCESLRSQMMVDCEKVVDEAFPTHPDNPDATPREKRKEHRKAHASWIKRVEDEMEAWRKLRQRVFEWATIGILGIIGVAVWQYLLAGPK